MDRAQVPQRLWDALDRKDVGVFLRYWSALPRAGRVHHPMATFVCAAIQVLGEERMDGTQRYATDERGRQLLRAALASGKVAP